MEFVKIRIFLREKKLQLVQNDDVRSDKLQYKCSTLNK